MRISGEREMEIERGRHLRWARGIGRALYLVIGALQCLLTVMFAVGLIFSAVTDFGEGAASLAQSLVFIGVVAVLFVVALFTLISALEEWDPPDGRWHGIRWPYIGLCGVAVTLISWAVVLAFGLVH